MEYSRGRLGRLFMARIDHGEDLHDCLNRIIDEESIRSGVVFVIGASGAGKYVAGPKEKTVPPEPDWHQYNDAREVVAVGTIANGSLHLHGVLPRGNTVVGGCLRGGVEAYLTLEAVIIEADGIKSRRELDPTLGIEKLVFQ